MDQVKSIFSSKTFWGAAIAALAGIGAIFGHTLAPADQATLVDNITGIAGIVGSLIAIYGRAVATTKIG